MSITIFVIALWWFGIVSASAQAVEIGHASMKIIRDRGLTDEDKERALQRASLTLLGSFVSITARAAAAFGVSLLPMLAFDATGLARFWDVANFLATWQGAVLASVVVGLVYPIRRWL